MYAEGIIQPGRSRGLRISLPRLNVLETQMGKDVLFSRSCQELFLERGQTNRKVIGLVRKQAGNCPSDTRADPQILNFELEWFLTMLRSCNRQLHVWTSIFTASCQYQFRILFAHFVPRPKHATTVLIYICWPTSLPTHKHSNLALSDRTLQQMSIFPDKS